MTSEFKRSVCPYDCPDTCGLVIEAADNRVVKVTGDPEHPYTRGTLCPKMTHYERTVHSPSRLTHPLLRTGEKGSGSFRQITWEEAIERITDGWTKIIAQYGAEAILPYSYAGTMGIVQRNCGEAFFHRLGASRLERTICSSAKGYGWTSVMGSTLVPNPLEAQASDFIILWGTNALATNIHFLNLVREAKKRGAKVWLVDTYETPTAQIADQVVMVRPGTDGALALGIMHIMVRENWIDQEFIGKHVQGFEEFKVDILSSYPPEKVSELTGIDVGLLEQMAKIYSQASAPFISLGSGLSRYGNGAMTVRTITCLPALVGAWAKRGGGLLANISAKPLDLDKIKRVDFMQVPTRIVNMNQLGNALSELSEPPIMSLFVFHSNPVIIAPDQNKIIQGLMREDLFTVVHERFLTDTARYADIVLPATTSLEHPDIYCSYGHYCIQRVSAVIPPLPEAKSNWEVFQLLAQAMDFEEPFFSQSADELIDQIMNIQSPLLKDADLIELQKGNPVELHLPDDYKMAFNTPSGKIEILNPTDAESLPRYIESYGDDAPYYLMSSPSLYSLNSSFNERQELVDKKEAAYLLMNPLDAEEKGLCDGQEVIAFNERGEVNFIMKITAKVPPGVVVSEGLFKLKDMPGSRSINALTSQRLTDRAGASTLYDVKVDVRPA
ncbi:MAG: formate dehydrogenase [Gracilibacter sp. BRH_c7a]|nr:MAG: formate dehydrogenase [Gracilibacter sp. BRH_c7a]